MYRFFAILITLIIFNNPAISVNPEFVSYGAFGKLTIYRPAKNPQAVVLFVSGEGGWRKIDDRIATKILSLNFLVVGVDISQYYKIISRYKTKCLYPAGDFEQLSLFIQKKYKITSYTKPILLGYSSGATLVYGILAQAPDNTFKGAISLSFNPNISIGKLLCKGKALKLHTVNGGGYYLETIGKLSAPFIVMQGVNDRVSSYKTAKEFMDRLHWGEFISLPKVGHDFAAESDWYPQLTKVFEKLNSMPSYAKQKETQNELLQTQQLTPLQWDYPITLIPTSKADSLPMAFFMSGDGGWTSFDQSLAESLAEKGLPVVGLDSQKYFWESKTPAETTSDLSKAVEHYMIQWNKHSFILVGYSFGASVIPFVANRLSGSLKDELLGVFALSPDDKGDFEIHVADMLDLGDSSDSLNVIDEMKKIDLSQPLCIFGSDEDETIRNRFSDAGLKIILLPGSHHYNDDYNQLTDAIINNIWNNK